MNSIIRKIALVVLFGLIGGCKPSTPSGDAEAHQAMLLMEQRNFTDAIPLFERSLGKKLTVYSESVVLTAIGNCYNELEDYELSHQYHDRAIAADPKNHQALVNKGVVYRLQGDYEQAEKCYMKALSMAPDYAELHASIGALSLFQEDTGKAIKHLEMAVKLDDTLPVAHSNLAVAYATNGQFEDADAELRKAVVRGYHQPELIRERIEMLREGK